MPSLASSPRRSGRARRGRRLALVLATLCATLAPAVPAVAHPRPVFGFGDQSASMFRDARWKALHIRQTRVMVAWDVFEIPWKAEQLREWMAAARAARVRPLVTFDRSFIPERRRMMPSKRRYLRLVRTFHRRYRWVRQFTPWNEANHKDQPTYRRPKRAAWMYRTLKRECRHCTVTSPVILPGAANTRRWVTKFRRAVHRRVRLWAVNDYGDFNRGTDKLLRGLERMLPGHLWVTETGGWVRFKPRYRRNEHRAARATRLIFRLARVHRHRVRRWYFYQWRERRADPGWDSGIIRANGRARPAYRVLRRNLR